MCSAFLLSDFLQIHEAAAGRIFQFRPLIERRARATFIPVFIRQYRGPRISRTRIVPERLKLRCITPIETPGADRNTVNVSCASKRAPASIRPAIVIYGSCNANRKFTREPGERERERGGYWASRNGLSSSANTSRAFYRTKIMSRGGFALRARRDNTVSHCDVRFGYFFSILDFSQRQQDGGGAARSFDRI